MDQRVGMQDVAGRAKVAPSSVSTDAASFIIGEKIHVNGGIIMS